VVRVGNIVHASRKYAINLVRLVTPIITTFLISVTLIAFFLGRMIFCFPSRLASHAIASVFLIT